MGIAIGVGVALFIAWFFLRSGDSSYESMADQINKEAEAQTEANLERDRQREAEAKAAKHEAAMKKAKYALLNHPKYGTVTWSGRGRKPKLLVEYLEDGGSLEELKVDQAD